MTRNVKLSRVAKLTLQFMKHNGIYGLYYNEFGTNRYKKPYLCKKDGYLKFLRDRIESDGWYLYYQEDRELDSYFIMHILFKLNEIHILLGGPPTYEDICFFYDMVELHFKEHALLGANILVNE